MHRWKRYFSPLLVALILAAGCSGRAEQPAGSDGGQTAAGKPAKPQVIGFAMQDDPGGLDSAKVTQLTTYYVLHLILDTLVYIDRDKRPVPGVAESWEVLEDGKVIIFKIRPGLKFTDGTPVDAQAVAFNFNRHLDPNTKSMQRNQLGPLTKVEVVGSDRVKFTFSRPFAPIWQNLASAFLGLYSPTALQKDPEGFNRSPVGSGPFMLREWKPASELVLVRNPSYTTANPWVENKGPMKIEEVRMKIIPEEGTRTAAFTAGEVHCCYAPLEDVPRFESDKRFRLEVRKENTNFSFLEMNPYKPPTDNLLVRKAIAMAVNREEAATAAYSGAATPNPLPLPTSLLGWDQALADRIGYKYNPAGAKQLLEQAGYTMGRNGVYEKDGRPLQIVMYSYTVPSGVKGAQVVMQQLKAVGFDVKLETQEVAANLAKLKERQHNINWMWWSWSDPIILSLVFKSPGWQRVYSHPELDKLLTAAETELDPGKRVPKIHQALEFLMKDAAVVPICTNWTVFLTRAELEGVKFDNLNMPLLHDAVVK